MAKKATASKIKSSPPKNSPQIDPEVSQPQRSDNPTFREWRIFLPKQAAQKELQPIELADNKQMLGDLSLYKIAGIEHSSVLILCSASLKISVLPVMGVIGRLKEGIN